MASMTSQLAALILPLRSLFEPLLDRIATLEALDVLFDRYGWRITLDETAFGAISEATAREDRARGSRRDRRAAAAEARRAMRRSPVTTSRRWRARVEALVQAFGRFEVTATAPVCRRR